MPAEYGAIARRLGIGSASLVAALLLAYAITLAAGAFTGSRLAISIRTAMLLSGLLALAGLSGVIAGATRGDTS